MKRNISMVLVLLTLVLLFVSWVDAGDTPVKSPYTFREEELALLKSRGVTDNMIKYCEKAHRSNSFGPFSMGYLLVIEELSSVYPNYGMITTVSLILLFLVLMLLKLLIQHLFGRRPRGYITWIIVLLFLVFFIWMVSDIGGRLTAAGFIAVAAMLASCILWGQHLKEFGANKGRYTLRKTIKCPKCGAVSDNVSNMFCGKCNALMDS